MDLRYFELHDLLCQAMIALEAGNRAVAERALRDALQWIESDWLATPSELPAAGPPPTRVEDEEEDA